ncbi:hypothetical protein GHL01_00385 [Sinorhizobium meliloti]|uniref:hypothetical protein n=1 Tax=Rhizobium meliloti TaxID=382 RepID=UPI001294EA54|nr:hypothetical protein [Sinorhizobium meliloti]MQV12202.1 hypothetical protein [Sinorhizobium meliloti]
MSIEQDILDIIQARVTAAFPEFEGRVKQSGHFPTVPAEWPCARVRMPDVSVSSPDGGRPGIRPQTRSGIVLISIIHDARSDDTDAVQRAITERIETALLADPYLTGADGKHRASDLKIAGSHADPVSNRGTVVAVRQLMLSVTWRTRENHPGVPMHA